MTRVSKSFAVLLGTALAAAGCATTHLAGDYNPDSQVPIDKAHEIEDPRGGEVHTLATGHDWVLFWGIVELQSTDISKKIKDLRKDELVRDAEVRNHISLGGALLWIVTAGLVSHHDVDFRGRLVQAKELPPPAPTVVTAAAPAGATPTTARPPSESELFADNRIDRPLDEVARDFDGAAAKAGLTTLARVKWDEIPAESRTDLRGEIPGDRLDGVPPSNIQSFAVTNSAFAKDVKSDPKCATHLPCVVCYDEGGKTRCLYSKPTAKLRALEAGGQVGDGKLMSRDEYSRHYALATAFERSCEKLVENLKTASKTP